MKILFVSANPTGQLWADREVRQIQDRLRGSKHGPSIEIAFCTAFEPADLRRALFEHEPEVVHISGLGSAEEGLMFQGEQDDKNPLANDALVGLLVAFKDVIRLVLFNVCNSYAIAEALTKDIAFAIGMPGSIQDDAAIAFAAAFYAALAFDRPVQAAFDLGKNAIRLSGSFTGDEPRLFVRAGLDARQAFVPERTAVRVFISYVAEDEPFVQQLTKHLKMLEKQGEIRLWHQGMARVGEDVTAIRDRELQAAEIILLLASPDVFASDNALEEMAYALEQHSLGVTTLVPILVRPVDWQRSPLGRLQVFPRDGVPVTKWPDADDAWVDVIIGIRTMLRFAADRAAPRISGASREIRPIGEIFRTLGQPNITLVEPAQLWTLRAYLRVMGGGLVVEGPSGVGKTTLVKMALRESEVKEQEWLLGQDENDRATLDQRLSGGFKGHLIVDDFHRLDRERQVRIAVAMKIIADRDKRDSKITVIGINPVGASLISGLPDVTGRFEVIAMGRQPDERVDELIRKGERAANIVFQRRHEFITAAGGSFFTAQQLCYYAAVRGGIHETAHEQILVDVGFHDVLEQVIENLDKKYFDLIRSFACHDERVPPRGACLALLWLLSKNDQGHVSLEDVRYQFSNIDVREALSRLKNSYLAQCFDDTPELTSLFYYNKGAGVLSIEDARLGFYLRHLSWPAFIERTGHRNARIDTEGKLVFSKRLPSDRPAPDQDTVHVLHLSDLHFNQLAQADVWYGQLAEDLRELECNHVNVLVLSGDLTQRADKTEFEAVRRFLLKLSTELKLSAGQVVMVAGNHDLSWSLSEAAYSVHRRKDYKAALEPGKFIAHGTEIVEVRDEASYKKRFEPFADFYGLIKSTPYSLDYADQFDLQDFPQENLLFLGLNSSWEIDHHYRARASIHTEALTQALARIRQTSTWTQRLKIAVWHHPPTGSADDTIKDAGLMQQLAKAGFRLVLHGHIHKAENALYRYDMSPDGRRIDIVSAGTFGAPTQDWVPGYPLQYNLLRISKQSVVVETRRREEPNGAWQPDARWLQGQGKDPLPRYEIVL